MIVSDTSLIFHLFNETTLTDLAKEILTVDPCWIVPPLWQEEYANILSKLARKERRDGSEVINHFNYTANILSKSEIPVESQKALRLSIDYKISVYDAYFVALAKDFNVLVVTEDKELIKKCPGIALSIRDFLVHVK